MSYLRPRHVTRVAAMRLGYIIISVSIDRRYRIMYMSYLRPRHVTRIAAMRLGCILYCLRVSCISRG